MRTGIPPLVLVGLLAVAMWLVARYLPQPAFDLPFRQAAAAAIGSIALVILALAVRPFRHARTTVDPRRPERASALVTDGVYSLSRNPMYVGMVLALIAWGLYLGEHRGIVAGAGGVRDLHGPAPDTRGGACARSRVRRAVRAVHAPGPSLDLRTAG